MVERRGGDARGWEGNAGREGSGYDKHEQYLSICAYVLVSRYVCACMLGIPVRVLGQKFRV